MSVKLRKNTRRAILASVLGLGAAGGILASAASLGVTANTLGAGTSVIASCDTDGVTVAYTNVYNATAGAYRTTTATVSGIAAACNGLPLDITLSGAAGAVIGSGSATIAGTSQAVTLTAVLPATTVDPALITGAAVVITG
jgi:hypothetical protein